MNLDQGNQQAIQLPDLFGVARRRGKLIGIVSGAVILVTFWIAMALPNLYTSYAVVLVEPQSVDKNLVNSGVQGGELAERIGLMTAEILGRSRLSQIINDMDLYEDEHDDMERFEVVELMRSFFTVEPVVTQLEQRRNRNKDQPFRTFKISFQSDSPSVARDVTQRIANDFINANISQRTLVTAKSLDFMQDEIDSLTNALRLVEANIGDVKEANSGRLPEEFAAHQQRLQYTIGSLREAQRTLDSANGDAVFWANQAMTASDLSTDVNPTSPMYRKRALEIDRGSLLARGFTNRHPDVIRVEAELEILSKQLKGIGEDGHEVLSQGEQGALAQQNRAELRAKAAQAEVGRLKETVVDLEQRLAQTPSVAKQLDALQRDYDQLYASYQDFSHRRQQAGVQADLERRQLGERFRILEPAERPGQPSSPNRIQLLILGTVLGLALGGGIGLIAEISDSSIHTSIALQAALGIPVLVSVPKIMLEPDRIARSRRILRESLAAVGVVVFVLAGGFATYYLVNGVSSSKPTQAETEEASTATEARFDLGTRRG
jgi:polysaccharide chain length determinant protein (PEP-CTERM system associated)